MINFFSRRPRGFDPNADFNVKKAGAVQGMSEKEKLLEEAGRTAKVGGWKFDIATMEQTWTDEVYRIHEVDSATFHPTVSLGIDFYTKESRPLIQEAVDRAIKTGEKFDLELEIITAKGNRRLVRAMGAGNRVGGKIVTVSGVFQDITDRKRAEERYKMLFESSHDAIMTLAPPDWRFTFGNPATFKLFDVQDEAQFDTVGPYDLSPEFQPDGQPSGEKAKLMIGIAMEKGSNFFEWTHKRYHGSEFPATVLLSRIGSGDSAYLQATVRDISVEKSVNDQLMQSKQAFEDVFNSVTVGILAADPVDSRFLFCNKRMEQLLGYTQAEIKTLDVTKIHPADDLPFVLEQFDKQVKGLPVLKKNGEVIYCDVSSSVKYIGAQKMLLGIFNDVTQKRALEKDLEQKVVDLEKMNKLMIGRELKMAEMKEKLNNLTK